MSGDFSDSPRLAELLARHALGLIPPNAATRLEVLFRTNPPDVLERLERACEYLNVTGDRAAELVNATLTSTCPIHDP